jgi:ubiquinone/menaquinone biosynthesis C-methylase UbiE
MTQESLGQLIGHCAPEALQQILWQGLRQELSPAVAVARLLIHTQDAAYVEQLLSLVAERASVLPSTATARQRAAEMRRLLQENRDGCARIIHILQGGMNTDVLAPSSEAGIAFWTQFFDRAVRQSEEASVAVYSLGNPHLLQEATAEVIALLDTWGVLQPERTVLQIGCGIGRFEAALASRVREVHGIDIAPGMVEAARRRCRGLANVHIQACSGQDLALFGARVFDLVYAVDSFPCVYQAGPALVERYFAEVARVLTPGGDFVLLNFTYRSDPEADRTDVQDLARRYGFEVAVNGTSPLQLWDGRAWWLRSLHPHCSLDRC